MKLLNHFKFYRVANGVLILFSYATLVSYIVQYVLFERLLGSKDLNFTPKIRKRFRLTFIVICLVVFIRSFLFTFYRYWIIYEPDRFNNYYSQIPVYCCEFILNIAIIFFIYKSEKPQK